MYLVAATLDSKYIEDGCKIIRDGKNKSLKPCPEKEGKERKEKPADIER